MYRCILATLALLAAGLPPAGVSAQERTETHRTVSAGTPLEIAPVTFNLDIGR